MPELKEATDVQIAEELTRRRQEVRRLPPLVPNPDFIALRDNVVHALERAVKDGGPEAFEDLSEAVYERTMQTIYGKDFWDWLRKVQQ